MFTNVNKYIDFIVENKLTQAQFLLLYCLRRKNVSAINKYKEAFSTGDGTMIGEAAKKDLIDRGFIQKVGEGITNEDYQITDKFNHIFLKNHFNAMEEFLSVYPGYIDINGKNVPVQTMDRYNAANIYAERIDYSVDEHLEVMKDMRYGREHNLIRSNVENFIRSESWRKIREIRLGQVKVEQAREDISF